MKHRRYQENSVAVPTTASLVLAAGRGSRMKGYEGNKTLLPLIPEGGPYTGTRPILLEILGNLPSGPKGVVVHHHKEAVMAATRGLGISYWEQPVLNGTGGALLAARPFLENQNFDHLLVTMGDVPLVRPETYLGLVQKLDHHHVTLLGFRTESKKRYGLLVTEGEQVKRIIEWEYWHRLPSAQQDRLQICNSGIYAFRKAILHQALSVLASTPHEVPKTIHGEVCRVKEYFITDLIQYLHESGHKVGYLVTDRPEEVMGVDDPQALKKAQEIFRNHPLRT
ncbi:MAG: NTP transferase domain-containing protein [Desulfobacteraceae bacterium]